MARLSPLLPGKRLRRGRSRPDCRWQAAHAWGRSRPRCLQRAAPHPGTHSQRCCGAAKSRLPAPKSRSSWKWPC